MISSLIVMYYPCVLHEEKAKFGAAFKHHIQFTVAGISLYPSSCKP